MWRAFLLTSNYPEVSGKTSQELDVEKKEGNPVFILCCFSFLQTAVLCGVWFTKVLNRQEEGNGKLSTEVSAGSGTTARTQPCLAAVSKSEMLVQGPKPGCTMGQSEPEPRVLSSL